MFTHYLYTYVCTHTHTCECMTTMHSGICTVCSNRLFDYCCLQIVQLQDKLVREGKLRTPTDLDAFWQKIQQPEVFYAHFKSQKSSGKSTAYYLHAFMSLFRIKLKDCLRPDCATLCMLIVICAYVCNCIHLYAHMTKRGQMK